MWIAREMAGADLGDIRRTGRLIRIMEAFDRQPEGSIPVCCNGPGESKAAYRFFDNDAIEPDAILQPHRERTARRAAAFPVVLVAQDTTEIDLTAHASTAGLGYLGSVHSRGLFLHNLLAISPDGVPLGVLDQSAWTRSLKDFGKRKTRNHRRTEDKESQRWLDGLAAVSRHLSRHPRVVLMSDRESDLFDLFAAPRPANVELLVRVKHRNRRVDHAAKYLEQAVWQSPPRAEVKVEVPRGDDRESRTAVVTLRWLRLPIRRPANHPRSSPAAIELTVIDVREEHPPADAEPIHWVLATTLPVETLDDALCIVKWYTFRWRIERLHFTLKSGCGAERHQLADAERWKRLLAVLTIRAWRVLHVLYEARRDPEMVCTQVFSADEWHVLHLETQGGKPLPKDPPTIRTVVRQVARLGGFLGRKSDGEPGAKTLWRGMRRLHDLVTGYRLARQRASKEDSG
jgi:hypothetical protein